MLHLIYGAKGSGKTGRIIDVANDMVGKSDGEVVFLTDTDKYTFKLHYNIRLVNVKEYFIETPGSLGGFIGGIMAANADVSHIYIDGIHRMTNMHFDEMEEFFEELDKIGKAHNVELVLTISSDELPEYMRKYEVEKA
jgi:hypothetical protein